MSAQLDALLRRYALAGAAGVALGGLLDALADDEHAPTTVREPVDAVRAHLADSLVALELSEVRSARTIADLGAGAGFPGLALAAALPAAHVTLVESNARKCAFIRAAATRGGIENAAVAATRVESWEEGRGACDLVTARALAPLDVIAEYAAPLLAHGGALVAWKGRRKAAEDEAAARAAALLGLAPAQVHPVVPYDGAEHRHLHVLRKVGETPARFPRRPGMARKRPLGAEQQPPSDRLRR